MRARISPSCLCPLSISPPPPAPSHCHYFRWCPPLICRAFGCSLLSLLSGPFHLSGAPLWRPPLRGFDFPSCLALPPRLWLLHSLPAASEASVVPPRRWAIIPGSNEERLSLCGTLTDTSPTHLSTNQTAGVGGHIELRVVVGKLRLRRIATSPSLFFCILLHPFLSISATSLSLTGCHSFQLSLLPC